MKKISYLIFKKIQKIKKYPQMFFGFFITGFIIIGFIIIAQLFIIITQDAQERLIDIRISSIQNSLSHFIVLEENEKQKIDNSIMNFMRMNPTVLEFTFYIKENDVLRVFTSSNDQKNNSVVQNIPLIANLALQNPQNSYTTKLQNSDTDVYQTFRSISDGDKIVGLIETKQILSQSDLIIRDNIKKGLIILIIILILILFLFFKYSKIAAYFSLYEESQKIDQLKNEFIYMITNVLKTPLISIRDYNEYIREGITVSEEYKEYFRRIDNSSTQLIELIEHMTDITRLEQGIMKFDIKKIFVPDFVKNIVSDFQSFAQEKKLNLFFEQEGLVFSNIMADEIRLKQALENIIKNAITYTHEGEIKVKIKNEKNFIEISISDTGVGMSKEEQKKLFEKFYKIKNNTIKETQGFGLGLLIAKGLIEKMNGTFLIESITGTGTRIVIQFNAKV